MCPRFWGYDLDVRVVAVSLLASCQLVFPGETGELVNGRPDLRGTYVASTPGTKLVFPRAEEVADGDIAVVAIQGQSNTNMTSAPEQWTELLELDPSNGSCGFWRAWFMTGEIRSTDTELVFEFAPLSGFTGLMGVFDEAAPPATLDQDLLENPSFNQTLVFAPGIAAADSRVWVTGAGDQPWDDAPVGMVKRDAIDRLVAFDLVVGTDDVVPEIRLAIPQNRCVGAVEVKLEPEVR